MRSDGTISIWFFIGISLLVNGVLIFGAGVYQISHPPLVKVVLYAFHASVWWGAILAIIGLLYCIFYNPNRA
jgi:FtsH-binding integral membrane protein